MTHSLKSLAASISAATLKDKTPPPPDAFNLEKLPFGVPAGINKFNTETCPACGKPPTVLTGSFENFRPSFLFRDTLSCSEYKISGMCQACQDGVFGGEDDYTQRLRDSFPR